MRDDSSTRPGAPPFWDDRDRFESWMLLTCFALLVAPWTAREIVGSQREIAGSQLEIDGSRREIPASRREIRGSR